MGLLHVTVRVEVYGFVMICVTVDVPNAISRSTRAEGSFKKLGSITNGISAPASFLSLFVSIQFSV